MAPSPWSAPGEVALAVAAVASEPGPLAKRPLVNYNDFTCKKCGDLVQTDCNGRLLKGFVATGRNRTSVTCPPCNSATTTLQREGLAFDFATFSPEESQEFWCGARGLSLRQLETHCKQFKEKCQERRSVVCTKGDYLPVSVWERLGWDANWVQANYDNYYDKGGIRFYQVNVRSHEETDANIERSGATLIASGRPKCKAKAQAKTAGKTAVPKLDSDLAGWTDTQHSAFKDIAPAAHLRVYVLGRIVALALRLCIGVFAFDFGRFESS